MTTNGTMRFMVLFVWLMVAVQIFLLIMGGGQPIVWMGLVVNLMAAIYVTTELRSRY